LQLALRREPVVKIAPVCTASLLKDLEGARGNRLMVR
jgi:hypothetical protein